MSKAASHIPSPPPGAAELPYDDGVPLESNRHRLQMNLLIDSLDRLLLGRGQDDFFVGGNMFLYYSSLQVKKNDFRGPDVFVVLGTERRDRLSWVVWDEGGRAPDVVIELTSPSTAAVDHGDKMRIYGAVLSVPEYFIFDPETAVLEGFGLDPRAREYQPLAAQPSGRLPSARLGLTLGPWQGEHMGYGGTWLRWFLPDGTLVPTEAEARAQTEAQKAEAEAQKAEAEADARRLAERLAAYEARFGPLPSE